MPLGDIQWTCTEDEVATDLLKERIEYGLENKAVFLGMGDYLDMASPSNRASLRRAEIYDNARNFLEDNAVRYVDHLYENILKPTKGKWLGLLEGHHFFNLKDGLTTDWLLAQKLGTEQLGWSTLINLEVTGHQPKTIWASHGCGSGQTVGSIANKIDKMAQSFEADVYLMGHWTRQSHNVVQRLHADWDKDPPELVDRTLHLVGTGGFSKGYVQGSRDGPTPRGTYVEQNLMRPTALGCPLIKFYKDKVVVEIE